MAVSVSIMLGTREKRKMESHQMEDTLPARRELGLTTSPDNQQNSVADNAGPLLLWHKCKSTGPVLVFVIRTGFH